MLKLARNVKVIPNHSTDTVKSNCIEMLKLLKVYFKSQHIMLKLFQITVQIQLRVRAVLNIVNFII